MLPNKPYKGNQIPNQPFYSPEVPATFDRLFGSRVANEQLEPNPSEINSFAKWVRPSDWLPLLAPGEMEEKFKGLFAVYNTDANFVAFSFEGDFVVDWGDGSIEYFNSGEKAQHSYQWDKVPFGTLTSGGYRQVVVTVTPQKGNHLTSMDLGYYHDNVALDGGPITLPWLDIAVSIPQAGPGYSISIKGGDVGLELLEKVTVVHTGNSENLNDFVSSDCPNLGEFNLLNAPNVSRVDQLLYGCYSLKNVNICDLPEAALLYNMFKECYSLEHVELTGLSGDISDIANIFDGCNSLKSVKLSGLTNIGGEPLYYLVESYVNQPNTRSLILEDLNSLENLDDAFYDWGWDFRGHLKLTGLTGMTDIDYGLSTNYGLESIELHDLQNVTSAFNTFLNCESLKMVNLGGTQNIESTGYMFGDCYSLETAPTFDTSAVTEMFDMFDSCFSLQNLPLYDTSSVENMNEMFYDCYSLKTIPQFDTSSTLDTSYMFTNCYSLEAIPLLDTSNAENMGNMFQYCQSLRSVPAFNVSMVDVFGNMFVNCTALGSAPLQGAVNDISFYNCCLSRNAILDIFQGLGTTSGATVDVTYNFGADDLTAEDIAIAEDKGWTVYY